MPFCNEICGSAENMVMMMMIPTSRKRRRYLTTVTLNKFKNTPFFTVQQYFCTLSHSQQSVQAATQNVKSTVQKSPCMSFHWCGGTVTVVKHKM